jgi:poly-gamma-glutamate synthase PgsB/CapB
MYWIPISVSTVACAVLIFVWARESFLVARARKLIPHRILVLGSRGKSGTVRLISSALNNNNIPTYAKITGTVAEEISPTGEVRKTRRLGPVSATEMADVLIRAERNKAQAVVFECMAILPKLIWFIQNRIVQAPIVIIPTIRLDHLEDEGDSITVITRNILEGLQYVKVLITGEQNEQSVRVMRSWAKKNDVEFIQTKPSLDTPALPGHHPTNIQTTLEVAARLQLDRSAAVDALFAATTEPDAEVGWEITRNGSLLRFSDLGGANDPQSAAEAILRAEHFSADQTIVPIIVNRWDRPLRTIAFAYSLRANPDTPAVGFIGAAVPQVRRALKLQGFQKDQIVHINWFTVMTNKLAIRKLMKLKGAASNAWFVMVENIHASAADRLRVAVHSEGTPVTTSSTPRVESKNA